MHDTTRLIYVTKYAMEMIAKGHELITTLDNPRDEGHPMWLFRLDETFDDDFKIVIGKE